MKESHKKILDLLGEGKEKTFSQLLEELSFSDQTLTTELSNLLDKGFISKKEKEEDRRYKFYELTEEGKKWYRDNLSNELESISEANILSDEARNAIREARDKLTEDEE